MILARIRIRVIPSRSDTTAVEPPRTVGDSVGPLSNDCPEVIVGKGCEGRYVAASRLNKEVLGPWKREIIRYSPGCADR